MPTLMRRINVIARCARLYRNDRLQKYGIHGTMDSIILNVCRNPGISQEALVKAVYIDKSNMTRKLSRLEKEGFITRENSTEDKRVQLVYPTEKAKEIHGEIHDILSDWNKYITEGLTEEQKQLLGDGLDKVLANAIRYCEEREEVGE